jgi:hypothetical protein
MATSYVCRVGFIIALAWERLRRLICVEYVPKIFSSRDFSLVLFFVAVILSSGVLYGCETW